MIQGRLQAKISSATEHYLLITMERIDNFQCCCNEYTVVVVSKILAYLLILNSAAECSLTIFMNRVRFNKNLLI